MSAVLGLAFPAAWACAAPAYDGDAAVWTAPPGGPVTESYQVGAGSQQLLLVAVNCYQAYSPTVSFHGQALAPLTQTVWTGASAGSTYLFYLAAPATFTASLVIQPAPATYNSMVMAFSYSGVDLAAPLGAVATAAGTVAGSPWDLTATGFSPSSAASTVLQVGSLVGPLKACTLSLSHGTARTKAYKAYPRGHNLGLGDWNPGSTAATNLESLWTVTGANGNAAELLQVVELLGAGAAPPAASASPSPTAAPSSTPTPPPTATPPASPTVTPPPTATGTPSPSPSAASSATPAPSATRTATPAPSATGTPSDSPTPTGTATPTPTKTASPSPVGSLAWTLKVYDSSGWLLRELSAGVSRRPVRSFGAWPQPYDPSLGPLHLGDGDWSFGYDGRDAKGAELASGVYQLALVDAAGAVQALKTVEVLGAQGAALAMKAGPNPLRAGDAQVRVTWDPALAADLRVYDQAGQLVRDLGTAAPPRAWDLRGAGGAAVADGVYVVTARLPGQRASQACKLAVAR